MSPYLLRCISAKTEANCCQINLDLYLIDLLQVLDLMCRMLGFSDEEKQRIGVAQQGPGKSVVRGVFGLPGRLVGGILGGGAPEPQSSMTSDDQVFLILCVYTLPHPPSQAVKHACACTHTHTHQLLCLR